MTLVLGSHCHNEAQKLSKIILNESPVLYEKNAEFNQEINRIVITWQQFDQESTKSAAIQLGDYKHKSDRKFYVTVSLILEKNPQN